jgi:hypothetical protein
LWKNTSTGLLDFYIDGVCVYRLATRGTAYNLDAPYFKCGVYDGPHLEDFGTKACYVRNVSKYTGNLDGYATVLGQVPLSGKAALKVF